MELLAIALGVIVIAGLVVVCRAYIKNYGYIFSPFNALILIFIVCLAVSPAFLSMDESWFALRIGDSSVMRGYTLQSMVINFAGFVVFLAVLDICVFTKRGSSSIRTLVRGIRPKWSIEGNLVAVGLIVSVSLFSAICLVYNNGLFPLLNGNRDFASKLGGGISQLYTISRCAMSLFGLYYAISFSDSLRNKVLFLVALAGSLLTGNRTGAIVYLLYPFVIMWVNSHFKVRNKVKPKSQLAIVLFCAVIGFAGVQFAFLRDGQSTLSLEGVIGQVVTGNTFCDVRDGALLLRGFDQLYGQVPIGGMTYLAGLLSFIPTTLLGLRSLFLIKDTWLWGPFSVRLAMWPESDHFGFRGGWSMEAYLNFGIIGIVLFALLLAAVFAVIDYVYRSWIFEGKRRVCDVLWTGVLLTLANCVICTSSMYELFVQIAVYLLLTLGTAIQSRIKRHRDKDICGSDEALSK